MASSALSLQGPIGVQDNRNRIINGDFNIFQRGTTIDIAATGGAATGCANSYVADRWRLYAQANIGITAPQLVTSRNSFDLGLPSGADASSKHYLNILVGYTGPGGEGLHFSTVGNWGGFTCATSTNGAGATDGGSFVALVQDIEDVRTFENKSCTLSFWAKSDITNQRVAPVLKQMFAGGTAGGSGVLIAGSTGHLGHTLDNTWRRYETSFNVPNIEGQPSLGSSGDDALQLQMILHANSGKAGTGVTFELGGDLNAGSTGNISFAQVQLEQGSKVTAFDKKSSAQEISECQRFYEKSYDLDVTPGSFNTGSRQDAPNNAKGYLTDDGQADDNIAFISSIFATRKRGVPTCHYYNPYDGTIDEFATGHATATQTATGYHAGEYAISRVTISASSYTNRAHMWHFTAESELTVTTT